MLKKILILWMLSVISCGQNSYAQANACSRPKVAVIMQILDEDELIDHLNSRYPIQPGSSWLFQIQEKVFAELRMNSPDVDFIPASAAEAYEYDYRFPYSLFIMGGKEDVEINGIKISKGFAFSMDSTLFQNPLCGLPGNNLGTIRRADEDIFRAIERNIDSYGRIGQRIEEFEESHPVPPRGVELNIAVQKEYVSPVKEERELDIKIEVKNCKGQPVFSTDREQRVILPRKTSRGELEPTKGFPQDYEKSDHILILKTTHPVGASATYKLKKGMDLNYDPIKIMTCGLDRKIVIKDVIPPIPIAGMGLKVKPGDVSISPGESTSIDIELFKVTPKGERQPAPNQSIEVKIEGLVDGSVSPQGKIRTDGGGRAVLTYRAGQKEEGIKIYAKYQPENYPDSIMESAQVTLKDSGCWTGTVEVIEELIYEEHKHTTNPRGESSLKNTIDINIIVQFHADPRKPPEIMSLDTGGSFYYELKKFVQYEAATCRKKVEGKSRDVTIRPGHWNSGNLTMTGKLIEINPKVYVTIGVDRSKNEYSFRFGIDGLRWQGYVTSQNTYYNACKGTTRNETNGPTKTDGEWMKIKGLHYEGQTDNPNRIRGIKTIMDKTLGTKITTFKWNIERTRCQKD